MKHNYRGIEYEITFEDMQDKEGCKRRNFTVLGKNGEKGWHFTIDYIMDDNFPNIKSYTHTGLPETEMAGILYNSFGV